MGLLIVVGGCFGPIVRRFSPEADYQLKLKTISPSAYSVRVIARETNEFTVAADGSVTVHVPVLWCGCTAYWFGGLERYDETPATWKVVQVRRGDQVVRELSQREIVKLPEDASGNRVLKLAN